MAEQTCPRCTEPITGPWTTINHVPHHIACANAKWREWFGRDLVPEWHDLHEPAAT